MSRRQAAYAGRINKEWYAQSQKKKLLTKLSETRFREPSSETEQIIAGNWTLLMESRSGNKP